MLTSYNFELFRFSLQVLFLLSFLVLIYHWLFYYAQLIFYKSEVKVTSSYVSIVIAFKDESPKLKGLINSLLDQNYKDFEIILVNDHSKDSFSDQIPVHEKIRIYDLPDKLEGKKQAIKYGIAKAKGEILLFTDADCLPESNNWVSEMVGSFGVNSEIVLGYSRFAAKNTIINKLIRFETFSTGIQYLSSALNSKPYMGVGRNMAFKKAILQKYDDLNHSKIKSGDDDLRVNQLATKENTRICISKQSITVSEAKNNLTDYFFQRRRQLEAGNHYKVKHRIHLAVIGLSQYFFAILSFYALFDPIFLNSIFMFALIKILLQLLVSFFLCRKLKEKDLWYLTPILEAVYIFLISIIGISTWIWKVDRWK